MPVLAFYAVMEHGGISIACDQNTQLGPYWGDYRLAGGSLNLKISMKYCQQSRAAPLNT